MPQCTGHFYSGLSAGKPWSNQTRQQRLDTGVYLRYRSDIQIKTRNKKSQQASDYSTSLSFSLSHTHTHTHPHTHTHTHTLHISAKEKLAVVSNLSGGGTIIKSSTL